MAGIEIDPGATVVGNRIPALPTSQVAIRPPVTSQWKASTHDVVSGRLLGEASACLARLAQRMCPETSGAIYLNEGDGDTLVMSQNWGAYPLDDGIVTVATCWAAAHHVPSRPGQMPCHHGPPSRNMMCIPLVAFDDVLGIVSTAADDLSHVQSTLVPVADLAALALSNIRLRKELQVQAVRDPLTGLFNRRYMEEWFDREIQRTRRHQRPLGVLMMDIDHFKYFNTQFGHPAGDAVLRQFGQVLRSHLRGGDIVCRCGGEEFIMLLPEASLTDTARRGREIIEAVSHYRFSHHDQSLGPVTVSAGAAELPTHGALRGALIEAADCALRRAKAQGRNRLKLAPSIAGAQQTGKR